MKHLVRVERGASAADTPVPRDMPTSTLVPDLIRNQGFGKAGTLRE